MNKNFLSYILPKETMMIENKYAYDIINPSNIDVICIPE